MNPLSSHYVSGEEIRAGDRVRLDGHLGRIVFVVGFDRFLPEFSNDRDWFIKEFGHGFMFEQDGGGLVFSETSDEDLDFLGRAQALIPD